jgi:hypothetical protein
MEPAPTRPRHEAIDHDDLLVHEWRTTQLTRLGIPLSLAQTSADHVDWHQIAKLARCADSGLDPDQWYPVSTEPARARHEAAAAIAVCTSCPVRAQCLELSLRHWDIGQHGVWGGLVAADRAHLLRRRPAGHRGRRRTAASGMIVRPPLPPVPLGLVGDVKSC